jgi:hypothetical protein
VTIDSDPPGAVVALNHTEVGRTPVTSGFLFYGDYDVTLRKEGYETLTTHANIPSPIYEQVPLDLVATALPVRIKTNRSFHFTLDPLPQVSPENQAALIERARELQARIVWPLEPSSPPTTAPAPAAPAPAVPAKPGS